MATSKIVVITGANTGIGLETVKGLLRSEVKYHILLGGRDLNKAKIAAQNSTSEITTQSSVEPFQVDVESDDSIVKAYEGIAAKHSHIDCLVNNAGACYDTYIDDGRMTTRQAWNKAYDVNVTGAHIMTQTFVPLLLKSQEPRLLFVSSSQSSLHEAADTSKGKNAAPPAGLPKTFTFLGYRTSKTGMNMMILQWARLLKNDKVVVLGVCPGLLATSLTGDPQLMKDIGARDPSAGGEAITDLIEGKRDSDNGTVVREDRIPKVMPW